MNFSSGVHAQCVFLPSSEMKNSAQRARLRPCSDVAVPYRFETVFVTDRFTVHIGFGTFRSKKRNSSVPMKIVERNRFAPFCFVTSSFLTFRLFGVHTVFRNRFVSERCRTVTSEHGLKVELGSTFSVSAQLKNRNSQSNPIDVRIQLF